MVRIEVDTHEYWQPPMDFRYALHFLEYAMKYRISQPI